MARRNEDILDETTSRTSGKSARNSNIEAARAVSEIIKTTLGPMGMDKMLIDSLGDIVITNDGVKILKEMEIEHPGAKLVVEVAKTQENEVGDGTTTAVILTGELLGNAQKLLSKNIHPTIIANYYKIASEKALQILNSKAKDIDLSDENTLNLICQTAMVGKTAESSREYLSSLIMEAATKIKTEQGIPKNRIKIVKVSGGNVNDSKIINGIVLDKEPSNSNMPQKISNPKILLIDFPLEVRELDSDAKVNINSIDEYEAFIQNEQDYLKAIVAKIKEIGANCIICQKGIDDAISYYFAKEEIIAVRRTRKSDMEKLSLSLNTPVISTLDDLTSNSLAHADLVEQKDILNEKHIIIHNKKDPKAITLILKASTKHVLDEIERAVEDSIGDLNSILKSKKIVAGGGAIELELTKELNEFAKKHSGKARIIIEEFANSFESIPRTIVENCGLDEIEIMPRLKAQHEKGKANCGINGSDSSIADDTLKLGIIEPINVKQQAIKSATEASTMIIRIDDIIAARKLKDSSKESEF